MTFHRSYGFYKYNDTGTINGVNNMEMIGVVDRNKLSNIDALGDELSYCQMWCMASSSGVLFLIGNLFNSIDEFNAGYNIS